MKAEQRGRRLRPVRRDAGQMRWTERDLVVLPWIGEQYAVRLDQLHALLSRQPLGTTKENGRVAQTTVRHCLERWRRTGVAQYMALMVGEPGWVWLTREGQRLAGLEYPFWTLSLSHLDHLYASTQARLWVETQLPEAWWRSERALRSEQAWVEAGGRLGHRPSAEVLIEGQARAVEVLTVWHQPQRVRATLPKLLARYPGGCWYFVTPRAQPGLLQMLAELEPALRARVRVIVLAELLREQHHPRRADSRGKEAPL